MSKEIKFRIWNKVKKKFENPIENNFHGQFFISTTGGVHIAEYPCGNGDNSANSVFDEMHPNNWVIQQFTGLKDKTGKDIYEGDIVNVYQSHNRFVVCFGKVNRDVVSHYNYTVSPVEINGFYFKALDDGKAYFSITKNSRGEHDLTGTEIIGNIFETPELHKQPTVQEDYSLSHCEQCDEEAWDGYICHACGAKKI